MSVARFRVRGQLDGTGAMKDGTVEIEREADLMTVRPLHSRETFSLPLSSVSTFICQHGLKIKVQEERRAKKLKRMGLG